MRRNSKQNVGPSKKRKEFEYTAILAEHKKQILVEKNGQCIGKLLYNNDIKERLTSKDSLEYGKKILDDFCQHINTKEDLISIFREDPK